MLVRTPGSLNRDKTGLGWGHLNTFGDYLTLVLFKAGKVFNKSTLS